MIKHFSPFTIDADPDATRRAYREMTGGAETCTCDYCKNWIVVRDEVVPREFLDMLDELGVDFHKDVEVLRFLQAEDLHYYAGWYQCFGAMKGGAPTEKWVVDDFEIYLCSSDDSDMPSQVNRENLPVTISFNVKAPWRLEGDPDEEY